ncbi:isopentenyl-diphosphate delta-isomerase [Chitinophaga skermanii]|uniref:Isopentenyl-diphosphate delta-isomerase n=1 Tax=Chitinophaga skermanii TaxID=331697 RepID=A0A327R1H6_9BACT|nr:isopentenyl-diphosphate Delta-isomerase [Chitinophaga skermanii]RAJ10510.1 isopentenyl-diphosphate delta-isomerase [Chitinophaga skermanii]
MIHAPVILVNEQDEPVGTMEKLEAHEKGLLHRAFSIFIFNHQHEMLLHQRATEKYHSGGLWTNACCSHPILGEDLITGAKRRLREEMGFECELTEIFSFTYKAQLDNNLTEHEFDHVLVGYYDGDIVPEKSEVQDFGYYSLDDIHHLLQTKPGQFTFWFKEAFHKVQAWAVKAHA